MKEESVVALVARLRTEAAEFLPECYREGLELVTRMTPSALWSYLVAVNNEVPRPVQLADWVSRVLIKPWEKNNSLDLSQGRDYGSDWPKGCTKPTDKVFLMFNEAHEHQVLLEWSGLHGLHRNDWLVRCWTRCYRPFTLGGDVHRPVSTRLPMAGPYPLGDGFYGFLWRSSTDDSTFVVESSSGGIIGDTLEDVQEDIKAGDHKVMVRQVRTAREQSALADSVPPEQFLLWRSGGSPEKVTA